MKCGIFTMMVCTSILVKLLPIQHYNFLKYNKNNLTILGTFHKL